MRYLKLSNNHIHQIRPGQFSYLKALNQLDLSANRIRHITNCAFHGLESSIKKLILNYNQISRLNSCAFTLAFRHLRFVQILHNPLNCTNNCEFFFTIYNPPYSINYEGLECVNSTQSSMEHCTMQQYDKIYAKCKNQAKSRDCSIYNYLENGKNLALSENPTESGDYIESMSNSLDFGEEYSDKSYLLQQQQADSKSGNRCVSSESLKFLFLFYFCLYLFSKKIYIFN